MPDGKILDFDGKRKIKTTAEIAKEQADAMIPATRADLTSAINHIYDDFRELGSEAGESIDKLRYDFTQLMIVTSAAMQAQAEWADGVQKALKDIANSLSNPEGEQIYKHAETLNLKDLIYAKENKLRSDIMQFNVKASMEAQEKINDANEIRRALEKKEPNSDS